MANLSTLLSAQSNLVTDQDLAAVATTGSYTDLTNKPTIPTGSYADLTNKPALFSGSYTDLTSKPTLFSGVYTDLTSKPTLFSGSYTDLTNKPTLGDALPSQANNAGKYLKTDGTAASWQEAASGGAVALNSATISANYSIPAGSNGFTVGPVIVANGVSVSIASGQRWLIV